MPKRNYKKIKIPIYFGDFIIICQSKYDDLTKIKSELEIETLPDGFDPNKYDAFAFSEPHNNYDRYFIFIKPSTKPGQIAHECKHIVNYIFNDRGIKLEIGNDEPECYLLSYLVNKTHEFINVCQKDQTG